MLNFDFQQAVLQLLLPTYVDEKRVDLSSKDLNISAEEFMFNLVYLKREKLIDLSSLSNRTQDDGIQYAVARAIITHHGLKVLANLTKVKFVNGGCV